MIHERPLEAAQRALIYAGAGGSLLLVLVAIYRIFFRVGARSVPLSEFIPITVLWILVTCWILSPYWGALKQGQRSSTRAEGVILTVALVLMIAVEANSFLATNTFVGGRPHPTADGVTIVFIPIVQWVVLGLAASLRGITRGGSDRSRP